MKFEIDPREENSEPIIALHAKGRILDCRCDSTKLFNAASGRHAMFHQTPVGTVVLRGWNMAGKSARRNMSRALRRAGDRGWVQRVLIIEYRDRAEATPLDKMAVAQVSHTGHCPWPLPREF